MIVTNVSIDTFWKGEIRVKGNIQDQGETYGTQIHIKGSQVYDYSCSCIGGVSGKVMCPHAKKLFQVYQERSAELLEVPVATSMEAMKMIREYTKKELGRLKSMGREQVLLSPRAYLYADGIRLGFLVGCTRQYVLKNLFTFADQMENGEQVVYGKNLEFYHNRNTFTPECHPLLSFLLELIGDYREYQATQRSYGYTKTEDLREIFLSESNLDRFFTAMDGQMLEVCNNQKSWKVLCRCENTPISIEVKKGGKDGYQISLPENTHVYFGSRYLYIIDHQYFSQCDKGYLDQLSIFFRALKKSYGFVDQISVNQKDMPIFYERVLKGIDRLGLIHWNMVDPDQLKPEPGRASFLFESPSPYTVTMKPTLSYGSYSFDPLEEKKHPLQVSRDQLWEYEISQVIHRYFDYKDQESRHLVVDGNDEEIYRLLSQGIQEFMALGEVLLSDSFKELRILPPPKVSLGVSVSENWLNLTIDAQGLDVTQLAETLAAYRQKKTFFRMKNGQFLDLQEDGYLTIAKLAEGLSIGRKQLKEKQLLLPRYRAFYLDSLMKEGKDLSFFRDQTFKAMVREMKAVEDSDFSVPAALKDVLRGYQKTGFRWLKTLDRYGFGGILADDMGLGKTLQVIALLMDEYMDSAVSEYPSLIVCPASLVYNWESEIAIFAPLLTTVVIVGSLSERKELLEQLMPGQIAITSYDLLKRDVILYEERRFRFQIIDEAQYIKNPTTQSAKTVKAIFAVTKLALTGTPIENRLSELWSIFDYLMPGFLFSYPKFKQDYELPLIRDKNPVALKELHRMIGPFILRRLKKDVLKDLPDKLETVLYSKMEDQQRLLYTANASLLKEQLETTTSSSEGLQILAQLTKLRQICCDPSLCFENYHGGSAKLETCMELLANAVEGEHKVLLFSQFTTMLDIVHQRLEKEGIPHYILTGATSKEERMTMVSSFQKDQVPVFLISLKAGGTGLNLTAADIVIHYDPWWNVAAQNQATDRTHRIGQEKQVTVFKLIIKNSVEENILKLQEAKRRLTDQVLTEGEVSFGNLSREDLLKLLGNQ